MKKLYCVCLLLLFLGPRVFAQFEGFQRSADTLAQEDRELLRFASELYKNGEFYRAVTELLRFVSYNPENNLKAEASFLIAESYYRAEKYDEAVNAYSAYIGSFPAGNLVADAEYKLLSCFYIKKDYPRAEELYARLAGRSAQHKWREEIEYVHVLGSLYRYNWAEASGLIQERLNGVPGGKYTEKYRELQKELANFRSIPGVSPVKAGFLSAVLPGSGQFYAGNKSDSLMAFLLTGISAATALNCYQNDADFGAAVFGFMGLSFYSANIYNAVNDAHKFNDAGNKTYYLKVISRAKDSKLFWTLDIELGDRQNGIRFKYKY